MSKNIRSLFGTDGIRAVAGQYPLTVDGIRSIGFAAGDVLKGKPGSKPAWVIGRDTRESGGWIERALTEGLAESGCAVFSCGVIPTSAVSVILQEKNFTAGAVVSASHNPPEFNGIKFFTHDGAKLTEHSEKDIEKMVAEGKKVSPKENDDIIKDMPEAETLYTHFLKKTLPAGFSLKGYKLVVDCANGSASRIAPAVLESFGAEVVAINNSSDGKNINVKCGATHPEAMQKEVIKNNAFCGITFDGDADRVYFADEKGRLLDGDALIGMAAVYLKEKNRLTGDSVVATVMANLGLLNGLKALGMHPVITSVGDRSVAGGLDSSKAVLGGEQSGHIIFREFLPTGDGLLSALQILSIVVDKKQDLSHFYEAFPKYPQVLLNVKVSEKKPLADLPDMQRTIKYWESKLNGDGRVLVRYSGTEPLIRIMVEGKSADSIKEIANSLAKVAKEEIG